jgi:hypothetical protein
MSQAGRDECQTFPVATLNNNDRRNKVAMANPRLLQTLSDGQCAAAAIIILARQRASKRQFQAQGLRPHHMPLREIALAAVVTARLDLAKENDGRDPSGAAASTRSTI